MKNLNFKFSICILVVTYSKHILFIKKYIIKIDFNMQLKNLICLLGFLCLIFSVSTVKSEDVEGVGDKVEECQKSEYGSDCYSCCQKNKYHTGYMFGNENLKCYCINF